MSAVPGAENQLVRHERMEVNTLAEAYMQDKAKVEKELGSVIEMLHHVAAVVKCSCPELVVFMWKINLDSALRGAAGTQRLRSLLLKRKCYLKG